MIWIPGVCLIYAMPELLQIPVAILITSFWVLIFTTVRQPDTQAFTLFVLSSRLPPELISDVV